MKTRKSKEETKTKQMQIVFPRVITQRLDVDVGKAIKLDRQRETAIDYCTDKIIIPIMNNKMNFRCEYDDLSFFKELGKHYQFLALLKRRKIFDF